MFNPLVFAKVWKWLMSIAFLGASVSLYFQDQIGLAVTCALLSVAVFYVIGIWQSGEKNKTESRHG